MTTRKQTFAALFALVQAVPGVRTAARKVVSWSDVAPSDQPALYQVEGKQVAQVTPRAGARWIYHAELVLYAHEENAQYQGAMLLADLLADLVDGVVAALAPLPGLDSQTLGGLVTDARIDGTIEIWEGTQGQQAVAIIPLLIIANPS